MSIDPYKANEKMKDFLKKATQTISNTESQKGLIDSQKPINDKCKNCIELKEENKELKLQVANFCDLIDPTEEKDIDECIKDLRQIIKQYNLLIEYYKKSKKFIDQQQKGRTKISLSINNIKYLRDIEKMTFEEIAKKYNVSRNTIRNRYYNN